MSCGKHAQLEENFVDLLVKKNAVHFYIDYRMS